MPFFLIISACSLFQAKDDTGSLQHVPLSPPLGPARRIVQEISAQWLDNKQTLLCILELDERHIAMAGLTKEGISLFNLHFDGKRVTLHKSPLMPDKLPPESIVTDLQLVFWPLEELQKSLLPSWRITADDKHRRIYFKDNVVTEVDYLVPDKTWPKAAVLLNRRYGYRLEIKTLGYEALSE